MSILRVLWIGLAVSMGLAMSATGLAALIAWWAAVAVGVVALMVPSALSLTCLRILSPAAVPAAVVALVGGATVGLGLLALVLAVVTTLIVFSGEAGEAMVQGAAYGDERRFPLRVPAAVLLPAALSWVVWAAATLTAATLLASRSWAAGALVALIAVVLTWLLVPRFHRLSRRWLVLVPAGVVLHDRFMLGETLMVQRTNVRLVQLALEGTEAADLTGPSAGHALEVAVGESVLVVFPSTREHPKGRAIHVRSFLVAPTRPGRALQAMSDTGVPVG